MADDYDLEDIRPTVKERMDRKVKHITFARTVLYLLVQFDKDGMVYATELSRYLFVPPSRAYSLLKELEGLGFVKRVDKTSNFVEWIPILNDKEIKLREWELKAKKTLMSANILK